MQTARNNWKYWIPLAVAVVIVAVIAYFLLSRVSFGSKLPNEGPAPAFSMYDLKGNEVSLENTAGKVRLVYFYFAHCPDVCSPTNYMLYEVQEGLKKAGVFGDGALIMSITFDPERDTTEHLLEYSASMQADLEGWYFLRHDDVDMVREVSRQYGVEVIPSGEGDFIHANIYTLIDGNGNIRKTYSPNVPLLFSPETRDDFIAEIIEDMVSLAK